MNISRLAMIEGSILQVSASDDLDLSLPASRFGFVHVDFLGTALSFSIQQPGFSYLLEQARIPGSTVGPINEFSMKGGLLRTADVSVPQPHGLTKEYTFGAWEGTAGCISTSKTRSSIAEMVSIFDSLDFTTGPEGIYFSSPVVDEPRPPRCIKEIPSFAVVTVTPLTQRTLADLPSTRGELVPGGELYRIREDHPALMLVAPSAIVVIDPRYFKTPNDDVVGKSARLQVDWLPKEVAG